MMAKRDPRVTEYINSRAAFARPILRQLRKAIHDLRPGLTETIKWGMPTFTFNDRIVCGMAGFKAHCALWFWNGKTVVGKKPAEAMGNFGRITRLDELPSKRVLLGYVKRAMRLNETGTPAVPKKPRRPKACRSC